MHTPRRAPTPRLMRAATVVALAALPAFTAACNDDDPETAPSTTEATTDPPTSPATTDAPTTSAAPTTSEPAPTTDPPTTSATSPPPTTIDEEALKAQIADDYERAFVRVYEILESPTLENLDALAAEVAAEDSPAHEYFISRVSDLVALGDRVVPNEPDIVEATVESVELVGEAPYTEARVVVCEVENRRQVTPPENTPDGVEVEVLGSGTLEPLRLDSMRVALTPNGWLRTESQGTAEGFPGERTCPPA